MDVTGKYIPIQCVRTGADIPTRPWYVTATVEPVEGKRRRIVAAGERGPMKRLADALSESRRKHVRLTSRKPRPETNPGAVYWLVE